MRRGNKANSANRRAGERGSSGDVRSRRGSSTQLARCLPLICVMLGLAACATREPLGTTAAEQTERSPVATPDSMEAVQASELDTGDAEPKTVEAEPEPEPEPGAIEAEPEAVEVGPTVEPEPKVVEAEPTVEPEPKAVETDPQTATPESQTVEAEPQAAPAEAGPVPQMDIYKTGDCERRDAPDDIAKVGDIQEVMEETTCVAALWMDGLFGEDRNLESARKTSGFLEASAGYSQFKKYEQDLRFRVRFKLPNLKSRFNVVIGRDSEDEIRRDRTERFAVRSRLSGFEDNSAWLAGLGYSLPGTENFSSDLRVGVSSVAHPRAFVQQPTRYVLFSDLNDLFYIRGTPFWNTRDGFGFTAGFNYNHVLTPKFLVRFTEVGTVSENSEGYDWFTGLILYQNLRGERALSYQLLIRGATDRPEPLAEYGGRVVYRHPLMPRRLYAELLTGYTWPRKDPDKERKGSAEVGLSLEVPFGRKDD